MSGDPHEFYESPAFPAAFLRILRQSAEAPDVPSMGEVIIDHTAYLNDRVKRGIPDGLARLDIVEALIHLYARLLKLRMSGLYPDDFQLLMVDCAT